jgi:hypothetical protein
MMSANPMIERGPGRTGVECVPRLCCPICSVPVKRLKNHLNKVHLGACSPLLGRAQWNIRLAPASHLISCSWCGCALKNRNLARHLCRVHHAGSPGMLRKLVVASGGAATNYRSRRKRSRFTLPAANIPSSLGRMVMIKIAGKPRVRSKSQSVRTVSGGLPETNRSRH